ncbi:PPE domain-containing protein, partial [Mycobacterium paragordonae]
RTVVSVYESARSMIVHPAVIAGNRNSFVSLVLSNIFGQNAPAIAAAEAVYEEFWAQDIAAMLSYHGGASAAAAALTPFTKLPLGQLAGAGGLVNAAARELAALGSTFSKGGAKAALGAVNVRLGGLLGGFNLSGLLSSLRVGTGNLANLNLHSLGLGDAGTGAAAAAGRWGGYGRHFSPGPWSHFGGSNVQSLVSGLSGGGLSSVLSSGALSAALSGGSLTSLLSSPVVGNLLSSPVVGSLLSSPALSGLLSSPTVSSLLSGVQLTNGSSLSNLLSQLGVGTGGPSAAAALSTPWGNFSLSQITGYVNSHGGLQAVLTNLSNSSAFTAWVDSGALASQLSGSGVSNLLSGSGVTTLLSSPAVGAVLSSPAVGAVLSSPLVSAVLS